MAVSFIAANSNISGGTSLGIATPTCSAGDLLIFAMAVMDAGAGAVLSPPSTGSWTDLGAVTLTGAFQIVLGVWGRAATGSEPGTLTASTSVGGVANEGACLSLSGADTTTILDAAASTASGATAVRAVPGITTASNGAMLVLVSIGWDSSVTVAPTGMTLQATWDGVSYLYTEPRPTAGATGARDFTTSNSISYANVMVAVRPAGAATATSLPIAPRIPLAILAM